MRRIFLFGLISLCFLLGIYSYHLLVFTDKKLHVIFCNIGQGDGIFIRTPTGADIIVDGGPSGSTMLGCLSRHMPLWDRTIEAMYLTHPDSDHFTGLIDVIKTYNVDYFGTSEVPKDTASYKELRQSLTDKKIPVHWVYKDDEIRTRDGFVLKTFWPTHEFVDGGGNPDDNWYSLIQEITYGKFSLLLDGDSPFQTLDPIINSLPSLEVFKPPHHGSKTGVDGFTFKSVVPRLAVLSFGYHNRYHHPAPSTIAFLKQYNIPYKDTLKGDVEIVSDGKSWQINN